MADYCYKLVIEYDGTDFNGWQIQPNKRTVQEVIQDAIKVFVKQDIKLQGAGRTDAGVHAYGQVASFCIGKNCEPAELFYKLNRILPDDIVIKGVGRTSADFDPRRRAVSRTYRYYIAEVPQALSRRTCFQVHRLLDISKLRRAATIFTGRHDFSSFCRQKSLKSDNHCRIKVSRWFRYGGMLIYEVVADRFLHHMVRRMVGAMLAVEESKLSLTQLKAFLNNKSNMRYSVPASGLVLIKVNYRRERK